MFTDYTLVCSIHVCVCSIACTSSTVTYVYVRDAFYLLESQSAVEGGRGARSLVQASWTALGGACGGEPLREIDNVVTRVGYLPIVACLPRLPRSVRVCGNGCTHG